ncbi:ABC transporter permease [Brevibacillus sp. B_LB10_24]|uniref:ABC transporter permease n=1 Tax=Brevibacillus sp. B_LB10_24 TaxID=3380645 RepID=UPI0038B8374E
MMWLRVVVGVILFLMISPILVMMPLSFSSEVAFHFPPPDYSLKWYQKFLDNSTWVESLGRSLLVACCTAVVATLLGTMGALAVSRLNFPGKKIFVNLMIAPMIIPVIVVAIAMYYSFSNYSLTNSISGLVLAHSVLAIPIVFVTVSARLRGVDENLELAAQSLGSSPVGAFLRVTLPIIRTAVFASGLFAFITSLDEVVVSMFIAGAKAKTLPVAMWESMRTQVDPTIAAVSTLLIVATVALFGVQGLMSQREQKL